MEILYILNTLILGMMLWDIHRGVKEIKVGVEGITRIAQDIHLQAQDLHAKTDELLRRVPPAA